MFCITVELVGILLPTKHYLPHIKTRDCLEVCVIIILKLAGMVYMYRLIMKYAITAQTAQSHLGNNKALAQLKVCIVMSIHNMEKAVVLNMLIANFPKYFNNCTDCAFHKFALIALFALIVHFITFFVPSFGARKVMEDL